MATSPITTQPRSASEHHDRRSQHVHRSLPRLDRTDLEQPATPAPSNGSSRPNYLGVDPAEPEVDLRDRGLQATLRSAHDRLPRPHITIDHIFGVNDQVAARFTVDATHTGDFGGIPPTGLPVSVTGHRDRPDHQRPARRRARQHRRPRAAQAVGCHRGSPQGPRTAVLIRRRHRRVVADTRPGASSPRSHRSATRTNMHGTLAERR